MNKTRSSRKRVVLAATILVSVTACSGFSTDPTNEVVVQTGQTVYPIPSGSSNLAIAATVTNTMDRALLLDGAGRNLFGLEKRVGHSWLPAYSAIHTAQWVPPIELAPGGSRLLTFGLYVGGAPNTYPQFEFGIPGTYRAVFGFAVKDGEGFKVYSNPFELRTSE